jgi:hypothetical protein
MSYSKVLTGDGKKKKLYSKGISDLVVVMKFFIYPPSFKDSFVDGFTQTFSNYL